MIKLAVPSSVFLQLLLLLMGGRDTSTSTTAWTMIPTLASRPFSRRFRLESSPVDSSSSSLDNNDYDFEYNYEDDSSTSSSSSWSETDDWTLCWAQENRPLEGREIFHQDLLVRAAERMEQAEHAPLLQQSPEDVWLQEFIETILNNDSSNNSSDDEDDNNIESSSGKQKGIDVTVAHNLVKKDQLASQAAADADEKEGHQVALLVRCQEVPQDMLVAQGRAVAELTWEQAHDVRQLIQWNKETTGWQATEFLQTAVDQLFAAHATISSSTATAAEEKNDNEEPDKMLFWDAAAVSSWMRQSLQEPCGKHDPRVLTVLSRFGSKGFLARSGLLDLYVQTIVGGEHGNSHWSPHQVKVELGRFMDEKLDAITAIWRDLHRHGISSPAQMLQEEKLRQLNELHPSASSASDDTTNSYSSNSNSNANLIMDECEIVNDAQPDGWYKDAFGQWQLHGKSSHEKVQLAADQKTPLLLQEGDYVYIDEESCIGCTQCALAAPASFKMLDNGRARTFLQRGRIPDVQAAVKTCPVNCMHYVGFDRLQTLEMARDSHDGDDGREDHRHFGRDRRGNKWRAHTPLHVSRMESSDANHKDSLYHYTRRQCYQSNQCPSKGCYDCPLHASNPEANPHMQQRRRESIHARAQTFQENGTADSYRKIADL